jgi:hypothetical protein
MAQTLIIVVAFLPEVLVLFLQATFATMLNKFFMEIAQA